jgi:RNA polymerase sigma factor (sigma-70 family)
MFGGRLSGLRHYLRHVSDPGAVGEDEPLLRRFIQKRDETAFAALLDRHGPMVLGVCRRVLGNLHDAEDAFQATFLVLAHKAYSIGQAQALGGWLYRVAQRTALRAKVRRERRRSRESVLEDLPATETVEDLAWHELRPVLDEEVNRLPARYRDAIVCCYLEEKTYLEAARTLGLAAGTVSSRLARGRDILRKRLLRRGLTLSSGLLVGLLSQRSLSAAVPLVLRDTITAAAVRLAAGQGLLAAAGSESVAVLTTEVLRIMFLARIRTVLVTFLVLGMSLLALGAGLYARWVPAPPSGTPSAAVLDPEKQPMPDPPPARKIFPNDFGYTWFTEPKDIGESVARRKDTVDGHWSCTVMGAAPEGGMVATVVLVAGEGGKTTLIQNVLVPDKDSNGVWQSFRPVVLDAEGKRYLPRVGENGSMGGGREVLTFKVFWLSGRELPIDQIRYVGIEYLKSDGLKAIDDRAAERARSAGLPLVPRGRAREPYDFTLTTLDGKQVRAADLRGKIVLLDCWSTTYHPDEAGIKKLYEKYHKDGLEIIGICLDRDAEAVKKYAADHGLTWPQVFVPAPDEKTRQLWIEATGLHENLTRCIDRKGIFVGDAGGNPHHLQEIGMLTGLAVGNDTRLDRF